MKSCFLSRLAILSALSAVLHAQPTLPTPSTKAVTVAGDDTYVLKYPTATQLSAANPFPSIKILDSDSSHSVAFSIGSNITANRTVSIVPGDANRTITMTGNATINQDTSTAGTPAFVSGSITGTAGNGFLQLLNQASAPSTPTTSSRIYVDASNRLSWKGTNGFVRTFDGTANTADRIYVLPDAAGNVVVDSATQTLSGKTLVAPVIGAATGTSLSLTGGNLTVNQSAADPTVHIKATANTFNPITRFEGFDRNFYIGVRDAGADGTFNISASSALTSPILSMDPATNGVAINSTSGVTGVRTATATLDFPSTAAGAVADLTITVTGAAVGDTVALGVPHGSVTATAAFFGWVSATNTVTVRFSPKATEDPASGTFRATVTSF